MKNITNFDAFVNEEFNPQEFEAKNKSIEFKAVMDELNNLKSLGIESPMAVLGIMDAMIDNLSPMEISDLYRAAIDLFPSIKATEATYRNSLKSIEEINAEATLALLKLVHGKIGFRRS